MEGKLIKLGEDDYILHVNNKPFAYKKLSLKNCQAVEKGYDLDELAKVNYDYDPYIAEYLEHEFKKGFQKALEILGDKRFSEKDIRKAILLSMKFNYNVVIQSLEQTEWDVSFNPDEKDSEGCLILKRL